jgi:DNA-directed RNA polymerase subunit RPC12/RpoP
MEIECLICGKSIKPQQINKAEIYDTQNYDGQIMCQECKSLLYIKLIEGKIQKYKVVETRPTFNWTDTDLRIREENNQRDKRK